MKSLLIALLFAFAAMAQEGITVNQSSGPPPAPYTPFFDYAGGSNLIYMCKARPVQSPYVVSVAGKSMTNIVVSTDVGTVNWTAHGLAVGNSITVAGTAVDTDLNATYYVQTVPDANSLTITTASVADGTYTTGLTITTTAPRNTAAIWYIEKYTYSGNNMVMVQSAGGTPSLTKICANRAATTGTTMITYQ